MPYKTLAELPDSVKHSLPEHGKDIYQSAFNNAWEQYKDPQKRQDPNESLEEVCHRVAWAAVKEKYKRLDRGEWVRK